MVAMFSFDRLGPFGACFKPEMCKPEDATIYATRPGLRIWKVNMAGVVQATYIYKDLLRESTPVIVVLPDTSYDTSGAIIEDKTFGLLKMYSEHELVTWFENSVYVLDPREGKFIGWHWNLGRIRGLAVCKDEIFILRSGPGRKVLRIAQKRDLLNEPGETLKFH